VDDFYQALTDLLKFLGVFFAGLVKGRDSAVIEKQAADLDAYRQREQDRREIAGESDDALERELRQPPH